MATAAILVDWCPAYLKSDGATGSLLLSPLGTSTLLQHVREQAVASGAEALTVVPIFRYDEGYSRAVRLIVSEATVTAPTRFAEFLDSCEPSDRLLIVDTRYCPLAGFDFRALQREASTCILARHLVHLQQSAGGTRERVVCDQDLRVRAIQRLYDGVTQFETAGVSASLIPAAVARSLNRPDLFCLKHLRTRLAASGVPTLVWGTRLWRAVAYPHCGREWPAGATVE